MKKYIKKVTVTGASDDTKFEDMLRMQQKYPFVEWGILYSRRSAGKSNRFPSEKWIGELSKFNTKNKLNLSVHLCGDVVNIFLTQEALDASVSEYQLKCEVRGELQKLMLSVTIADFLNPHNLLFSRMQINTHGEKHKYDLDAIESYLKYAPHVEFIAQYDEVNDYIHRLHEKGYKNISALYDLSHGAGVLPAGWNKPLDGIFTGYAGGLSVDNLEEQLKKLDEVVSEPIWIDAETWLRTNDLFDLDKVEKFLEIAESRVIIP